ncbi:MAG: acylphosphatase [Isosphaeraceae bacterium]|nr:acylphosphatase [Isosphaeraceae bacterium]
MPRERRRVYYRGRVQGVGFRYTTYRLAQGFAVSGSVRNLEDGRVELIAEGEPGELDAFQDAIQREFADEIRDIEVIREPPSHPPPSGFSIRH